MFIIRFIDKNLAAVFLGAALTINIVLVITNIAQGEGHADSANWLLIGMVTTLMVIMPVVDRMSRQIEHHKEAVTRLVRFIYDTGNLAWLEALLNDDEAGRADTVVHDEEDDEL